MIRPLEYCENEIHLLDSIETIDFRILELIVLRKKYLAETKKYTNNSTNGKTTKHTQKIRQEKCTLATEFNIDRNHLEAFLEEITNLQTNKIKKHG